MIKITPTGFKVPTVKTVLNTPEKASSLFKTLSKSETRKLRKTLREAHPSLAAAPRNGLTIPTATKAPKIKTV